MDKSVDAGDDLCERSEAGDGDYLSLDYLAELVVVLEDVPRILGLLLVDKRYLG